MAMEVSKRQLGGISVKHATLLFLTLQTTAHVLVLRYSWTVPTPSGQRYFISTAVVLNEVLKLTLSLTLALFDLASSKNTETSTATALFSELARAVFSVDQWKMAILAMLYTLQNGLQYLAIGNLDASTFQITNQLKIFTTAIFSMLFLGKTIDARKWTSLAVLLFGIMVVALSAGPTESPVLSMRDLRDGTSFHEARSIWDLQEAGSNAAKQLNKRSATYEGIDEDEEGTAMVMQTGLGLLAVIVSCVISGFAGSILEKVVREPRAERSIWVRNIQLSCYSLMPALFIGANFIDGEQIAISGFFAGYTWAVWLAIVLQAIGGVALGFLVKIDGNLSKSVSGGVSTLLVFVAGLLLFDLEISSYYVFGTMMTLSSLYVFSTLDAEQKPRPPQIRVPSGDAANEKSYFDLESNMTPAKSPLRADQMSLSTSRPSTPTFERRPRTGNKSTESLSMSKLH